MDDKTARAYARRIQRNVRSHLNGMISSDEFDRNARNLWDEVSEGELRIIGSRCDARMSAVIKHLPV